MTKEELAQRLDLPLDKVEEILKYKYDILALGLNLTEIPDAINVWTNETYNRYFLTRLGFAPLDD